jgi:hypothetical protein
LENFKNAIEALSRNEIKIDPLPISKYRIDDWKKGFEEFERKG